MKLNKKAEEPRTAYLPALIALFVLVIIFLFFFGPGREILDKFGIIIPNFNATKTGETTPEILRYEIGTSNLAFYDGIQWVNLEDTIKLGDKKIDKFPSGWSFVTYYFYSERELPYSFEINKQTINGRDYKYPLIIESFKDGSVYLRTFYTERNTKIKRYFMINKKDEIFESNFEEGFSELEEEDYLVNVAIAQRDGEIELISNENKDVVFPSSTINHLNNIVGLVIPFDPEADWIYLPNEYSLKKQGSSGSIYRFYYGEGEEEALDIYLKQHTTGFIVGVSYVYAQRITFDEEDYEKIYPPSASEQEIISKVKEWHDSILSQPMEFTYNNEGDCLLVPVEKKANKYLVIDLTEGTPCPEENQEQNEE
ncbi:MAG: hypothetical protein KJ718_06490 [Nanoarchaeota archaeon]|nr:hypothetical protein [Nanoarchaeota archaeon]MBU1052166.1 hypothetical protein [Nanoarchaeota archaeon]MBU1987982.1 hypothetical protein [Nanoarchaeota archaeon]